MQYLLVKGIAGLGNRLGVLGGAIDCLADHPGAFLVVDWRDKAWRTGFDAVFRLDGLPTAALNEIPDANAMTVWPELWRDGNWLAPNIGEVAPGGAYKQGFTWRLFRELPAAIERGQAADLFVWAHNACEYSGRIFRHLGLARDTARELAETMRACELVPGDYDAWHIRATDKQGVDPATLWPLMREGDVLCTDNLDVAQEAARRGVQCPMAWAIPRDCWQGGTHHLQDGKLAGAGLSKIQLNRAAVIDLCLLGLARKAYFTCARSSYGWFCGAGRRAGWFSRLWQEATHHDTD